MEWFTRSNESEDEMINRSYEISDDNYSEWLHSVKVRLGLAEGGGWKPTIYKVPRRSETNLYKDPYSPHIVSIGPLHHRRPELIITETHKWTYMLYLLNRTKEPIYVLNDCARAVRYLEWEARRSYVENIKLGKLEMMEILLVDACFMLEIFIRYTNQFSDYIDEDHHLEYNDPILGKAWLVEEFQQDFALVENQIPYFLLQSLFVIIQVSCVKNLVHRLPRYALYFFSSALGVSEDAIETKYDQLLNNKNIMHVLDMLHHVYSHTKSIPHNLEQTAMAIKVRRRSPHFRRGQVPSARYLYLGGIQLVRAETPAAHLVDVTFHNGVLRIPLLRINGTTNRIFQNLEAFEQLGLGSTYDMSSYAILMSSLIKSSEDVKLLEQKRIIERTSGEAGDVVDLFEHLFQDANMGDYKFAELSENIEEYIAKRPCYRRVVASLRDSLDASVQILKIDYFKNIWTTLSVVAAIILLALTALQTVYTLIAYYH